MRHDMPLAIGRSCGGHSHHAFHGLRVVRVVIGPHLDPLLSHWPDVPDMQHVITMWNRARHSIEMPRWNQLMESRSQEASAAAADLNSDESLLM